MIPAVSRDELLTAMARFDQDMRQTETWASWEQTGNHTLALEHEGRRYPAKQIIALAAGGDTTSFHGDAETNQYLAQRGFTVQTLQAGQDDIATHGEQGAMRAAFERFRQDPLEHLRVKIRRWRAEQIRALLAKPEAITLDIFNREVWAFETRTLLRGEDITGTIFNTQPLRQDRIDTIDAAIEADALELHGNYVWGSATRVYGAMLKQAPEHKEQYIRQALETLNSPSLRPIDKARKIIKDVLGFGENITTGVVMLYHPNDFAIYNQQSTGALELLGNPVRNLEMFQTTSQRFKKELGATDFIELDWFFYLINQRIIPVLPNGAEHQSQGSVHEAAQRYLVNQPAAGLEMSEGPPTGATSASLGEDEADAPEQPLTGEEVLLDGYLRWLKDVKFQHPVAQDLARRYPQWLQETYGNAVGIRPYEERDYWGASIFFRGNLLVYLTLHKANGLQVLLLNPADREVKELQQGLSDPTGIRRDRIRSQSWAYSEGYRCVIKTLADYEVLKRVTRQIIQRVYGLTEPIQQKEAAMARLPSNPRFYEATQLFVDQALRADGSLFTPGRAIWSAPVVEDLYERFVKHPDDSQADFMTKFQRQLKEAPADTIQLAAELFYVHLIIATQIKGPKKRELVRTVLGWSSYKVDIPETLAATLDHGVANAGVAYLAYRPYQLAFLVQFTRAWKQISSEEQTRLLADPWAFKHMLFQLPIKTAYAQREALLHLVHPDTFERIVSREHKQEFAAKYADLVSNRDDDVDRRLQEIRRKLTPQHGEGFSFYTVKTVTPQPLDDITQMKAYIATVLRMGAEPHAPEEIAALAAGTLQSQPDADELVSALMLLRLVEPLADGRVRRWHFLTDGSEELVLRYSVLTMLQPGEDGHEDFYLPLVKAPFDGLAHPETEWPGGAQLLQRYQSAGLVRQNPDGRWEAQPGALDPVDDSTQTGQAINIFLGYVAHLRGQVQGLPSIEDRPLRPLPPEVLEQRIAEIQRELLVDRETLLRIYRTLLAGHHVILSGPPGTGKTHLACILPSILWRDDQSLAMLVLATDPALPPTTPPSRHELRRDGYATEIVTATEDWGVRHVIGGIVPRIQHNGNGSALTYGIRHGHLTRAILSHYEGYTGDQIPNVQALRRTEIAQSDKRYLGRWLVIDEFTRAPIDAAFGSLLTTLGGQANATVPVPTDDGHEVNIRLPKDFRIIGTLNSFDRHFLNQISEAMKRRFTFIDLQPPGAELGESEQAMAVYRALVRLGEDIMSDVLVVPEAGQLLWDGVLEITRELIPGDQLAAVRYRLNVHDPEAAAVFASFWRIFKAIRAYRQIGTAQAEAVYKTMIVGFYAGMGWAQALDTALADVLGDQLQVLNRDEQRVLVAYLEHAGDSTRFAETVKTILERMPPQRQEAHLRRLLLAGAQLNDVYNTAALTVRELETLFEFGAPHAISARGAFAHRLNSLINESGL